MITHKHLRVVIEDIYLNDNKITEDLLNRLMNEFRYSNLYIAAKRQDDTLNFITYGGDDSKITPLFTDLDEFHKFYGQEDLQILNNSFELYQNIIKTTDIEGYILNPATEKYLFDKEFILSIKNIPKTNFYTTNPYSEDELREIYQSMDNSDLEEFIEDKNNIGNWEALFEKMSHSTVLSLMISNLEISDEMIP